MKRNFNAIAGLTISVMVVWVLSYLLDKKVNNESYNRGYRAGIDKCISVVDSLNQARINASLVESFPDHSEIKNSDSYGR